MTNPIILQTLALILVSSGVFALFWSLQRKTVQVAGKDSRVRQLMGEGEDYRQFALRYLQLEGLVIEGCHKIGVNTRKIGGLYKEPVDVDTWSLMLELLRKEKITFKTYTTYLHARRLWIQLLSGRLEVIDKDSIKSCSAIVDRLTHELQISEHSADKRVEARLASAGASI